MNPKEYVQSENVKLLKEIWKLKTILSDLYAQSGSNSSDYITFSCELNFLVNEYVDEKLSFFQDQLAEIQNSSDMQQKEMIKA